MYKVKNRDKETYTPFIKTVEREIDSLFMLKLFSEIGEYTLTTPSFEDVKTLQEYAPPSLAKLPDYKIKFMMFAVNAWEYIKSFIDAEQLTEDYKKEILSNVQKWAYNCTITTKDNYDPVKEFEMMTNTIVNNLSDIGYNVSIPPSEEFYNFLYSLYESSKLTQSENKFVKEYVGWIKGFTELKNLQDYFSFTLNTENVKNLECLSKYLTVGYIFGIAPSFSIEDINENVRIISIKKILEDFYDFDKDNLNNFIKEKTSFLHRKSTTRAKLIIGLLKLSKINNIAEVKLKDSDKEKVFDILSKLSKDEDLERECVNLAKDYINYIIEKNPEKINKIKNDILEGILLEKIADLHNKTYDWFDDNFFKSGIPSEYFTPLIDDLLNNPADFITFYSTYIETIDEYLNNPEMIQNVLHSARLYSEFNNITFEESKDIIQHFYITSTFVSKLIENSDKEYLNNLNEFLVGKFNEFFLSPVIYTTLKEKYGLVFTEDENVKVKEFLKNNEYSKLITYIRAKGKYNDEVGKFLNSLTSLDQSTMNKPYVPVGSAYEEVADSTEVIKLSESQIKTVEEWVDYLKKSFERDVEIALRGLLNRALTSKNAEEIANLMFTYTTMTKVYEHIKNKKLSNLQNLTPDQQIIYLIEGKRAFWAAMAYYLNQNSLFNPGRYIRNGVHDCYDFASVLTTISDLGLVIESPEEFQALYVYFSTKGMKRNMLKRIFPNIVSKKGFDYDKYYEKTVALVKETILKSIKIMSWDDPHKKILTYLYGYMIGIDWNHINRFSPIFEKLLTDIGAELQDEEKINRLLENSKDYAKFITNIVKYSDAGNFLVCKWVNSNEIETPPWNFKLSLYYSGKDSPDIVGKWMYFNKCSPNSPGQDHQAIFIYDVNGNIKIIDFHNSGKVTSLKVYPKPSWKLTRYGNKWYVLWTTNQKMSVRLTRIICDRPGYDIQLPLHIPSAIQEKIAFGEW